MQSSRRARSHTDTGTRHSDRPTCARTPSAAEQPMWPCKWIAPPHRAAQTRAIYLICVAFFTSSPLSALRAHPYLIGVEKFIVIVTKWNDQICITAMPTVQHRNTDAKTFLGLLVAGRERCCAKLFRGLAVIPELLALRSALAPARWRIFDTAMKGSERRRRSRERATRRKGEPTESYLGAHPLAVAVVKSSLWRGNARAEVEQIKYSSLSVQRGAVPSSAAPFR